MQRTLYSGLAALDRALAAPEWQGAKYIILLDENTFTHCLPLLIQQVEPLQEAEFIEVPVGEDAKSPEVALQVWQTMLEGGADRDTVIVNLGGGCVSDLGGYLAAGYMRGLRHINIPTTLLSMVDAAIGGKTAINFGGVKNSLGHFHFPALTVVDTAFLSSLPPQELLCGQMEMVKTAAVTDASLFDTLLSTDTIDKHHIVATARIKSRVVKADPYDRSVRRILNFGHTFGHAVELHSQLPHGIAVGIGMLAAFYLSVKKTGLDEAVYRRYGEWLRRHIDLPRYTLRDIEAMLPLMHRDKKNAAGEVRCVLLADLGAAVTPVAVSDNEVRDAFLSPFHS